MYETHFGLRIRPFRAGPDTTFYYPSTGHEQALEALVTAVRQEEGYALLTAPPGFGKTLACHVLLERMEDRYISAAVTNSHCAGRPGLLQALLYDFSLPYEGRGEQELRLTLTDHILREYGEGRQVVLLVDEAHHLSPDLLEELRLLGNLEGRRGKAVQVLLAGQPGLLDTLRLPELAGLNQRIAVRPCLPPLSVEESADFVSHQLRLAGGRPEKVLEEEALEMLARAGRGIPRLLNQAAHLALTLAHEAALPHVDAEVVLDGLARLGLELPEPADEEMAGVRGLRGDTLPMTLPTALAGTQSPTAWTP